MKDEEREQYRKTIEAQNICFGVITVAYMLSVGSFGLHAIYNKPQPAVKENLTVQPVVKESLTTAPRFPDVPKWVTEAEKEHALYEIRLDQLEKRIEELER